MEAGFYIAMIFSFSFNMVVLVFTIMDLREKRRSEQRKCNRIEISFGICDDENLRKKSPTFDSPDRSDGDSAFDAHLTGKDDDCLARSSSLGPYGKKGI